jgi:hypothetical protein
VVEMRRPIRRLLSMLGAVAVSVVWVYHLQIRTRMLRWGATDEEVGRWLPGDDTFADQPVMSTRALTIDAPSSAVWPWLVQVGYGRAGWYSYDLVERLLLAGKYAEGHSATRIHPELQTLSVGDEIPFGLRVSFPVTALDPERHLGVGSWSFVLEELSDSRTRLLVRSRGEGWVKPLLEVVPVLKGIGAVIDYAIGEPLHHFMERRMMLGLAHRAEHPYTTGVPDGPFQAE